MFKSPLISIIVPCYNYAHFLPQTLDSILAQTYQNWECIVVDDGSTDDTDKVTEIYRKKDKRIKYIFQKNKGLSSARNAGIKISKGEFIQFLDADDLIVNTKLEKQVKALFNNIDIGIHYGISKFFFNNNISEIFLSKTKTFETWMPKISGQNEVVLPYIIDENIMVVSSPLIRRQVVDRVGFFDENLKSLEDWDYWARCIIGGIQIKFEEGDEVATLIRVNSSSMMSNSITMLTSQIKLRKKWMSFLIKHEDLKELNSKKLVRLQDKLYKICKQLKQERQIIKLLKIMKYLQPFQQKNIFLSIVKYYSKIKLKNG